MMGEDLSIEELEKRACALEQELNALRSVIAARRTQEALSATPPPLPTADCPPPLPAAGVVSTPAVQEEPVASSLRLSGYLSDASLWDIAIPFSSITRNGGVTIGREATMADVPLPENGVSRLHLRLEMNDSGLAVVDLGSTNGTFINSCPLTPNYGYPLNDGDTLTIGTVNLRADMLF